MPSCLDAGLGLLPWSPLGGGWLTGKYTPGRAARPARPGSARTRTRGVEAYDRRSTEQRTWDVVDAVREVAEGRGVSMAQVALAWLVDRPGGHVGDPRRPDHRAADDNLGAAGLHLDAEETARARRGQRPRRRRLPVRRSRDPPARPHGRPRGWLADARERRSCELTFRRLPAGRRGSGTICDVPAHGACGCSSVGRARPSQGRCREFESRHPLHTLQDSPGNSDNSDVGLPPESPGTPCPPRTPPCARTPSCRAPLLACLCVLVASLTLVADRPTRHSALSAPRGLRTGAPTATSLTVRWAAPRGAKAFRVQYSTSAAMRGAKSLRTTRATGG